MNAVPHPFTRLAELDDAWRARSAGERFDQVRLAAPRLKAKIAESGRVACVRTLEIADLPYPTSFAFAGAARSPVPYIVMTNRMNVVQFDSADGPKTLLFNPTDAERSAETPFFRDLRRAMGPLEGPMLSAIKRPTPAEHVASLGLSPEDVDYIAFDHLHTQDVRRLLGTTEPHVAGMFPRAKLLVDQRELDILRSLHPLQIPWFVRDALRGVDPARVVAIDDADLLLGAGVAIVRTPGHTDGNWSLVLNTHRGVWTVSENGVACDSYAPEASRIAGLREHTRRTGVEVILNANTLEGRNEQYTSMILERSLADRVADAPDFYQHFPSSELRATPFTASPTYRHGVIESGEVRVGRARIDRDTRPNARA